MGSALFFPEVVPLLGKDGSTFVPMIFFVCGIEGMDRAADDSSGGRICGPATQAGAAGAADATGERFMHDILIALAFVGMVFAPAIVAAKSSAGSMEEGE